MNSYALLEEHLLGPVSHSNEVLSWLQGSSKGTDEDEEGSVTSSCGWTDGGMLSVKAGTRRSSYVSAYSANSDDTELQIPYPIVPYYDSVGVYHAACKRFNELAIAAVLDGLTLKELRLRNQNIKDNSVKALVMALAVNDCVTHVDLSQNRITLEGLDFIQRLMKISTNIVYLDLSHNNLGSSALEDIAIILQECKYLRCLLASGNNFGPRENYTKTFTKALQYNRSLQHLDLGYNQFSDDCGLAWAAAIAGNLELEKLILRWNHLRWRGAMLLLEALTINDTLRVLDLAWNGVSNDGAQILNKVFRYNTSLEELDLTCNRISHEGAVALCEGLRFNSTLKVLKMNKNPITTMGASHFLLMFDAHQSSGLERLELLDIEVDREFKNQLSEIQASERTLEVIHGGHVIQGEVYMQNSRRKKTRLGDPLMVFFEHIKNSNLRLWDMFSQLDKDKSLTISRDEFRNGMKDANLPLDDHQINRIMDMLDKDRDGEITFEELLEGHKRYREKERKKYETLLPSILSRPSSARQSEIKKDVNTPMPRVKANTFSMTGYLGDGLDDIPPKPRLSLPEINVISEDNQLVPLVPTRRKASLPTDYIPVVITPTTGPLPSIKERPPVGETASPVQSHTLIPVGGNRRVDNGISESILGLPKSHTMS